MNKAKQHKNAHKYSRKLGDAKNYESQIQCISSSIDTLVTWMQHDVLCKAGSSPIERRELYDFILEEFKNLATLYSHRINAICVTLENQREQLLAFTDVLNEKFKKIAEQFCCSLNIVWHMCELQRCKYAGDTYAVRSVPLVLMLKNNFDPIEDAVLHALDSTERTSSLVENLNSRLSPYFFLRREIGGDYLELLQFFLNHTPFMRSSNPNRVGKTPAELLHNKKHPHWLEMLGLKRTSRIH